MSQSPESSNNKYISLKNFYIFSAAYGSIEGEVSNWCISIQSIPSEIHSNSFRWIFSISGRKENFILFSRRMWSGYENQGHRIMWSHNQIYKVRFHSFNVHWRCIVLIFLHFQQHIHIGRDCVLFAYAKDVASVLSARRWFLDGYGKIDGWQPNKMLSHPSTSLFRQ